MLTLTTVPPGRTDGCPVSLRPISSGEFALWGLYLWSRQSRTQRSSDLSAQGTPGGFAEMDPGPGSGLPIRGGGLGMCISNKSQVVLLLVPHADTTLRQDPEGSSC